MNKLIMILVLVFGVTLSCGDNSNDSGTASAAMLALTNAGAVSASGSSTPLTFSLGGLIWQNGSNPASAYCNDTTAGYCNNIQAVNYCTSVGGRLPTKTEIDAVFAAGNYSQLFQGQTGVVGYYTSSVSVANRWVYFSDGTTATKTPSSYYLVRCVF